MTNYTTTDLEKDKQKSDTSKASISAFIVSSIYFYYSSNWIYLFKLKTLIYLFFGIFGSGILLGMLHYYLAKFITYLLLKTIRKPTESTIKTYSKLSLILGILFFVLGLFIDFQLTKLYFSWWYA
jgi:hypothetical protein